VHGSGDLTARGLQAQNVRAILSGPGNMTLSGSGGTLSAEISGSGDLNAKSLQLARAVTRSRGPGNIFLNKVSDALEAELSGSGDLNATTECKSVKLTMNGPGEVKLDGKVDNLNAQLSGSGNLNARSLWANQADVTVRGPGNAVVNVKAKADQSRLVTYERSGMRDRDN
jgi:hypothetical protein